MKMRLTFLFVFWPILSPITIFYRGLAH